MATTAELERMIVRLIGDGSSYQQMCNQAIASSKATADAVGVEATKVEGFGSKVQGFGRSVLSFASSLVPVVGTVGAIGAAIKGIQLASEAERMVSDFGVMLQSVELGQKMVKDLQKFAAETPLGMGDLQQATKTLLQFGVAGKDIIPTIRMLGDTALGDAQKLQQLSLAFGQVMSTGRLMGQDLLQMINAGFNPLQEISRKTGKDMATLKKEMEGGRISADMVIGAFKSATSEGGNFAGGMEKASKTLSGLFSTMEDDISAALREIGQSIIEEIDLKGIVKDVSAVAQMTTDWFKSIPAGTKTAIASILAVGVATAALTAAFFILKGVITATFGGLNLVTAAIIAAIAGVSVGVGSIVAATGGIAAAWAAAKQKAQEFWDWLQPIRHELANIWDAIQEQGLYAWGEIKKAAKDAWDSISGSTNVNWERIRNIIIEVLASAEFYIRNLKRTWDVAVFGMQLALVVLEAEIRHLFTQTLPYLLDYFSRNWKTIFLDAFTYVSTLQMNLVKNMAVTIAKLPDLVQGKVNLEDILKPLDHGFKASTKEALNLPKRMAGPLENMMKNVFGQMWDNLDADRKAFVAKRMAELGMLPPGAVESAEEAGEEVGKAANKGIVKEIKKVDAALVGSAESFARLAAYRQSLALGQPEKQAGFGQRMFNAIQNQGGFAFGRRMHEGISGMMGGRNGEPKAEGILSDIRDILKEQNKKPQIVLSDAGLLT